MPNTGACVTWNDKRCKSNDFIGRKKYQCTPEEALRISGLPTIKYENILDIEDSDKYEWHEFLAAYKDSNTGQIKYGDCKYGRYQYCPKTGIKRSQTMGEFYGGGIVD